MNNIGKWRWGEDKKFDEHWEFKVREVKITEFECKDLEMNNIGKSRRTKCLNLNWIGLEMIKIGKLKCWEAKKFEFEFKGLEMNKIG